MNTVETHCMRLTQCRNYPNQGTPSMASLHMPSKMPAKRRRSITTVQTCSAQPPSSKFCDYGFLAFWPKQNPITHMAKNINNSEK